MKHYFSLKVPIPFGSQDKISNQAWGNRQSSKMSLGPQAGLVCGLHFSGLAFGLWRELSGSNTPISSQIKNIKWAKKESENFIKENIKLQDLFQNLTILATAPHELCWVHQDMHSESHCFWKHLVFTPSNHFFFVFWFFHHDILFFIILSASSSSYCSLFL